MGEMKNTYKILVAKSESRGRFEDLSAPEIATCTFIFKQYSGMCELLALGSGWELVESCVISRGNIFLKGGNLPGRVNWLDPMCTEMLTVVLGISDLIETTQAMYRGADKSLARPGMKQATATEDFYFHISYL